MNDIDKAIILEKAICIMLFCRSRGMDRNETTRLAMKLVARMIEYDKMLSDEEVYQELEFITRDI